MFRFKVYSIPCLALLAVLFSVGDAEAAKPKPKKVDKTAALFAKLDTNGDKKLSKDEFAKLKTVKASLKAGKAKKTAKPGKSAKKKASVAKNGKKKAGKGKKGNGLFEQLDKNKDGVLSPAEFSKLKEVSQVAKAKKTKKAK